ncbi:MAG TPA: hypothetical protein P5028_03240, partial [Candidatus Marinimicrobia bacterium]|nr:hypothetical protein [Candidatus Neomarinimicrobiota bacterium]
EADYLRGLKVFVPREYELKKELIDLIGFRVRVINSAKDIGFISSLDETNPQALFVIKSEDATLLVPAVTDLIKQIDPEQQIVIFKDIEGLFPK